jgi:thiamine kinase-like enzyme
MRNPSIFVQAASQLGRMHKLSSRNDFPSHIRDADTVLSADRLQSWRECSEEAASGFLTTKEVRKKFEALDFEAVLAEKDWISEFVVQDDPKIRGSGLDVVFSHWDYQENNILQTPYGLRCIDFEYSGMEYQAWDIAAYFIECTIDYLVDEHPFFKVSLSDFPTEKEQRMFCAIYLSEYLETEVQSNDLAVSVLMERVQRFVLISHYLWTIWSVIKASQSLTYSSFDYLQYAKHRWFLYKRAKCEILHPGSR